MKSFQKAVTLNLVIQGKRLFRGRVTEQVIYEEDKVLWTLLRLDKNQFIVYVILSLSCDPSDTLYMIVDIC